MSKQLKYNVCAICKQEYYSDNSYTEMVDEFMELCPDANENTEVMEVCEPCYRLYLALCNEKGLDPNGSAKQ